MSGVPQAASGPPAPDLQSQLTEIKYKYVFLTPAPIVRFYFTRSTGNNACSVSKRTPGKCD